MSFDPAKDIPNLHDKIFLITGGTKGLGKQTIITLAQHTLEPLYFTGRNAQAAHDVIAKVKSTSPSAKLTYIPCDHSSLLSIQAAAKDFLSRASSLDVLICNAGVMATEPALTIDGYENQFGVNHVAHALLVKLLLPTLQQTAEKTGDARILSLTSIGFMYPFPGGVSFDSLKTTQDFGAGSEWARYGQSKPANVQYAAELARRYPSITSVLLHPGAVDTELIGRLKPEQKALVYQTNSVILTPEGVHTTYWCATVDKAKLTNGGLYLPVGQVGEHSKESADQELQGKLWTWTEKELEGFSL